ncbi:NAD(P)H-binding protein [Streptomyces sp. CA-288835]|uniref:NAD(P)H-binding protein n=1 Tax=Streptomyces sp. CA-288835 TaxID=3240069 RepID=UPI003D912863
MRVVIAGGHGEIALILEKLLTERGHCVAALVRNPAHAADLAEAGAEALVVDLEKTSLEDITGYLAGADAVVFAAGAGAGSESARPSTATPRCCSRMPPRRRAWVGTCSCPAWRPPAGGALGLRRGVRHLSEGQGRR